MQLYVYSTKENFMNIRKNVPLQKKFRATTGIFIFLFYKLQIGLFDPLANLFYRGSPKNSLEVRHRSLFNRYRVQPTMEPICWANWADPGFTFNFAPTKDPQCWPFRQQPANRLQSHPKQLWGAAESSFCKQKR